MHPSSRRASTASDVASGRDDCVRRDVARKPEVFQKRGPHRINRKMMRKLQSGLDVSRHVLHEPPLLQ